MPKNFTIAIAGNPNCGKTALFNALTGSRQSVGNWPGVTVERKEGYFTLDGRTIRVVDLPGTYALFANSEDERVAVDYLISREADLVINILDATNVERNLFLTTQIADMQVPMLLAVNMIDIAKQRGLNIDLNKLSKEFGVSALSLTAVNEKSVETFKKELSHLLNEKIPFPKGMRHSDKIESVILSLEESVTPYASKIHAPARWVALQYLANSSVLKENLEKNGVTVSRSEITASLGEEAEFAMAGSRYQYAHKVAREVISETKSCKRTFSDIIDSVVLNRVLSLPIFLVVMYLVFWIAITIGSAFIDFFDILFGAIFVDGFTALLESVSAPDFVVAILASGVGAGIQTVSTFIPVVFFMFLCLSFLEDSGYMARAAFVADRFMRFIGLPGRAFVPLMVGFGCGVPGIMGSRVLESKRERFLTIFLVPFMSCGARLPVYALFAAAFFGTHAGTLVFLLYLTGIIFAIAYGLILRRSLFKGNASNFVMELPPYHLPKPKSVLLHAWHRLCDYIFRAGKVITLAVTILGFLNSFGIVEKLYTEINGETTEIVKTDDGYAIVQETEDGETENVNLPEGFVVDESKITTENVFSAGNDDSDNSLLSKIGMAITPVFEPFGVEENNWPASVSLFTGLLAKEAVVGTMNSLYSIIGAPEVENSKEESALEQSANVVTSQEESTQEQLIQEPSENKTVLADSLTKDSLEEKENAEVANVDKDSSFAEMPSEKEDEVTERVLIAGVDECSEEEEEDEESALSALSAAVMEALQTIPDNLSEVFLSLLDPLGVSGEMEAQEAAELKQLTLEKIEAAKVVSCSEFAALSSISEDSDEEDSGEDATENSNETLDEALVNKVQEVAKEAEIELNAEQLSGLVKLAFAGVEINADELTALAEGDLEESAGVYANLHSYFTKGQSENGWFNWQIFAFLVFVLLYVPCMAAMGTVVREIGLGLAVLMGVVQTIIAWCVAVLLYQIPVGKDATWIVVAVIGLVLTFVFLKLFGIKANKQKRFDD